uniref:Putative secreted protein n=1 Tax=Anopheles darlingi TaxID=43151 RepID=A0A2M4D036_ANODA
MSIRLVAMMTLMFFVASKPSSWFNSSNIVRWTSESPPLPLSIRDEPMESISSMKMIDGACSRAITNNSRTIREPSPMNFCTSSDPDTRMKVHSVW